MMPKTDCNNLNKLVINLSLKNNDQYKNQSKQRNQIFPVYQLVLRLPQFQGSLTVDLLI